MTYTLRDTRTQFLFDDSMPADNIGYTREGGCFISISRGFLIAGLIFFFGLLLCLLVFFTTKHAYQPDDTSNLHSFIQDASPAVPKFTKTMIPKHYRLQIMPFANHTEHFHGTVWIAVTTKKENIRRIELNIKDIDIFEEDVFVYRSNTLSSADFQSDVDLEMEKHFQRNRWKREADDLDEIYSSTYSANDAASHSSTSSDEYVESTTTPSSVEQQSSIEMMESLEEQVDYTNVTVDNPSSPATHQPIITTAQHEWREEDVIKEAMDGAISITINKVFTDRKNEKLIIALGTELKRNGYYIIKIHFTGRLGEEHGLFYTATDSGFFVASITEPTFAHEIFPVFQSEYKYITTFQLSIVRKPEMKTLANTQLTKSEPFGLGLILDTYKDTPPMPLSSFGFIVSDMDLSYHTKTFGSLTLQIIIRPGFNDAAEHLMEKIPQFLEFINNYTGFAYDLDTIKVVFVPHQIDELHEAKRGLILLSENLLLENETDWTDIEGRIAYDLARLWIAPLFVNTRRGDLWLKEALPLFLSSRAVIGVNANMSSQAAELFVEKRIEALRTESYFDFVLTDFASLNSEEDELNLLRNKGLCLLNMFNTILTDKPFENTIKAYLRERIVKKTSDFAKLSETWYTKESGDLKKTQVYKVINSWMSAVKYPIVTVTTNFKNGSVALKQEILNSTNKEMWKTLIIPTTFVNNTNSFGVSQNVTWFMKKTMTLEGMVEPGNSSWIIFNPSGTGYYRANYDVENWRRIIALLQEDFEQIPKITRIVLTNDALNLARHGFLSYELALKLVMCWKDSETDSLAWEVVLNDLEFLYEQTFGLSVFRDLQLFLTELISSIYETSSNSTQSSKSILFNALLETWACRLGFIKCLDQMREEYNLLVQDNGLITPAQKTEEELYLILCIAIKNGGRIEWETLQRSLDGADKRTKSIYIRAMGCSPDPNRIISYLDMFRSANYEIYYDDMLESITDNRIAKILFFELLDNYFDELEDVFEPTITLFSVFKSISTELEYKMLQEIFIKHSQLFDEEDAFALRNVVSCIEETLKWKRNVAPHLSKIEWANLHD